MRPNMLLTGKQIGQPGEQLIGTDMTPTTDIGAKVKRCAVCKIDFKGRFVFVDDAVEQLLGLSKEELFGKSILDFIEKSEQPTLAHVLYQRNRYETFFESLRLELVDHTGRRIPSTVLVSLNFIAGNPVNFQIIIDVEDSTQLESAVHGNDISFQEFVTSLPVDPAVYCEAALTLIHRYAGVRRTVIYSVCDKRIEPARCSDDRIAALADLASSEALMQWVMLGGDDYFYLDSDAVRNAIEKTGSAPNELIMPFELSPEHEYILRMAFEENADSAEIQEAVSDLRTGIHLARRLAPTGVEQVDQADRPLSALHLLQVLEKANLHCCLTRPDGSIRLMTEQMATLLKLPESTEQYRDIVVSLSEYNGSEAMQRVADTISAPAVPEKDLRFDEVVGIAEGRRARLIVTRLSAGTPEESVCFVMIPLSQPDAARFDGSIDNASLQHILVDLQSTTQASSAVAERLAHEFYDELGRDGNYYLTSLVGKTQKLHGMIGALHSALEIVEADEAVQTIDLSLLADTLTEELRNSLPGLAFVIRPSSLPKIAVRPRKLATALRNILVNSLKYARPGGVEISIQAALAGGFCSLSISDNGPGIPARFLSQVQDYYFRAPDPHTQAVDGLGCGLAIVRQIMKSLGGRMKVVSEPDHGTTVTLVFPVTSVPNSKA
jgi:PAS domain S-box-containing protein